MDLYKARKALELQIDKLKYSRNPKDKERVKLYMLQLLDTNNRPLGRTIPFKRKPQPMREKLNNERKSPKSTLKPLKVVTTKDRHRYGKLGKASPCRIIMKNGVRIRHRIELKE